VTIAILAGGESRRFGQDKVALFLPRLLEVTVPLNLPVLIVGRTAEGVPSVPDDFPGQGPLGGIVTALRAIEGPILALACDLVFLETGALLWLQEQWEHSSKDLPLVPTHRSEASEMQYEPLFAVYPQTCLPSAERLLSTGRRSLQGFLREGCYEAPVPDALLPQLRNINTPEDLIPLSG
jgi:molybdenum cofactor guanylyltransferase